MPRTGHVNGETDVRCVPNPNNVYHIRIETGGKDAAKKINPDTNPTVDVPETTSWAGVEVDTVH